MISYLLFALLLVSMPSLGTTPNAITTLEQTYIQNEQKIDNQKQKHSKVLNELLVINRNLKAISFDLVTQIPPSPD